MDLPKRKATRLKGFDYSSQGVYFITICTKDRKCILSEIVGTGVLDCPQNTYSEYGKIADKYICQMNNFYKNISVDKYIIMPNHIHLLITVKSSGQSRTSDNGQSRTPVPTDDVRFNANSTISGFVGTFKRFCNKEYGENIWQSRFHDHIIRGENDYLKIWNYIDTNICKWEADCFYTGQTAEQ